MKNALIIIDVQNGFINEHTKSVPEKIARFISDNKFDFLLFTNFANRENSNFFKLLHWEKCIGSPDTDVHRSLEKFVHKNNLFTKASYSVFKSKKLVNFLKRNEITKIYLCGIDIDACVLASAFEAFDLGYEIEIFTDLSLSQSGERLGNAALEIIQQNLKRKT